MLTVQAILGNKVAAPLADVYLARTGYGSQQIKEKPIDREEWRDNLFEPVPDKAATHGIFDRRSRAQSRQLWLSLHRGPVLGAAAAVGAGTLALLRAAR